MNIIEVTASAYRVVSPREIRVAANPDPEFIAKYTEALKAVRDARELDGRAALAIATTVWELNGGQDYIAILGVDNDRRQRVETVSAVHQAYSLIGMEPLPYPYIFNYGLTKRAVLSGRVTGSMLFLSSRTHVYTFKGQDGQRGHAIFIATPRNEDPVFYALNSQARNLLCGLI